MEYMSDSDSVMSTSEYQRRVALITAGIFALVLAGLTATAVTAGATVGVLYPASNGDYPMVYFTLAQVVEYLESGFIAVHDGVLHLAG